VVSSRRGGGRVVWGGDACVALAGGERHLWDEGDASVPSHRIRHSRPYGYGGASEATSYNTYP
jgi:hypothetical protein